MHGVTGKSDAVLISPAPASRVMLLLLVTMNRRRADLALYAGAGAAGARLEFRPRYLDRADDGCRSTWWGWPARRSSWGRCRTGSGGRPVLLGGLGLMVAASLSCSFAETLPQLIAARFFQALAAPPAWW